jgi:uncharacterized protein YrrD
MIEAHDTAGFLVADSRGRPVGQVECPMFGAAADRPDALAVRARRRYGPHFIVPAAAIETIDDGSRVIRLLRERDELQRFL